MMLRPLLLLLCLPLVAACADTELPDLTLPAGPEARVGIDLGAEQPLLGLHMTDPFDQRRP